MSKVAWKGPLSALQCHLAYACADLWQTHWAKMSLDVAAGIAAKRGHNDLILYLCARNAAWPST